MANLTVLIIRHAEKPGPTWPGDGTASDGSEDPESLVIRGWQRSGAWAALFGGKFGGRDYPCPAAIYAANPDPGGDANPDVSKRPFETATPLAAKVTNAPPVATFGLGQEQALVTKITEVEGVVLVCWEHKAIARTIVPLLLGGQKIPDVPKKWDGARFDVVFRFDRDAAGAPWAFRQLCPCLLSGDSADPMPLGE
jgi:hypothetical protein